VVDDDSFVERTTALAKSPVASGGGKPDELVRVDESPVAFEGTAQFDLEDTTAARFSRSRFVRFRDGSMVRFTCYATPPNFAIR
jgi:hypothetical protein